MKVVKQRFARQVRKKRCAAQFGFWPDLADEHVWQKRFYDFNVWNERKRVEKLRYDGGGAQLMQHAQQARDRVVGVVGSDAVGTGQLGEAVERVVAIGGGKILRVGHRRAVGGGGLRLPLERKRRKRKPHGRFVKR